MVESYLHLFLKKRAIDCLSQAGYATYLEPAWSPVPYVQWQNYRPDVLGVKTAQDVSEYAFVECETRPRLERISKKKTSTISYQTKLTGTSNIRLILVIPAGTLRNLSMKVRRQWEIWIIDRISGTINKIDRMNN
ncbi:MAG: hypothetical protein O6762_03980 [Thaumarchaeota archaeon]|nr:hypothetical protein [Nitrososphaerota archaeon]